MYFFQKWASIGRLDTLLAKTLLHRKQKENRTLQISFLHNSPPTIIVKLDKYMHIFCVHHFIFILSAIFIYLNLMTSSLLAC